MGMRAMLLAAVAAGAMLATPAVAQGWNAVNGKEKGAFLVRGRMIEVMPLNSSSSTSIGGTVTTTNALAPEVDFSYFLTDNIALELIAATTKHQVSVRDTKAGSLNVGSTWVLPPALTLQYHFNPKGQWSPYLGAGINYTIFYSTSANSPFNRLSLTPNVGAVLQLGMDVAVSERSFVNVDIKQIFLSTNASVNSGTVRASTNLNPLVVGVGYGYRF